MASVPALQRLSFTCTKLSEPLIPAALLVHTGEAKKALIPDPEKCPAPTECDISQDHTQTMNSHQNLYAFEGVSAQNKMQCCGRTCPWGLKGGVKPPRPQGSTWLTVSDPFSALFFPSEDFQLPNAVLTDTISPWASFQPCSFLSSLGPHPH